MRSLTRRGRTLLVVGVMGIVVGWFVDQPSIVTAAVLLAALPVLGLLVVRRTRFVIGAQRSVSPSRLPFGDEGEVRLTLENASRLPSGALLVEDQVPEPLGRPTRLVLDRLAPRAQRTVRYPVVGRQRGRTRVGPLTVRVTDPFGVAAVTRAFSSTNPVLVTPRVVAIDGTGPASSARGRGATTLRAISARGDDDLLPREHRPGDDMRRIHWRATARQGELMVRREEQPWHNSITVILDDRERAHHGQGAASTFEWAVSAAASLAVHYARGGWRLTAITTTGRVLTESGMSTSADVDAALQAFADVRTVDMPMAPALGIVSGHSTVVAAVLGRMTDDTARPLVQPAGAWTGCLLLEPGPVEFLRAQGWHVGSWTRSTPIDEAWAQIIPTAAGVRR